MADGAGFVLVVIIWTLTPTIIVGLARIYNWWIDRQTDLAYPPKGKGLTPTERGIWEWLGFDPDHPKHLEEKDGKDG